VRRDSVEELAFGLYYSGEAELNERWRATFGARFDSFDFDVASNLGMNSGSASDSLIAPKVNVIYTVSPATELYVSAGKGFHSNDARGTTIVVDPSTGEPADAVDPLVASRQFELGFRSFVDRKVNVSAALFYLELDSELLFIGDAGNTEPSRPSERFGLELPLYYRPTDRLTLDFELALTTSRFADSDPVGEEIPGAIDRVVAGGVTYDSPSGWYGSVRLRHFGPRPLIEDGSAKSDSSTLVNAAIGFRRERLDVRVDVLNVLDSDDHDITYFYASRLPGESEEGVEDLHFHPLEPRMLRAYLNWRF
jgi:outer membrane receptor protein involved in Fe transport